MTDFVTVEPAHEMRPEFALWALAQSPPLNTSSASGFDVPIGLYPSIPEKLLNGAYVDGYHYNRPSPQPVAAKPVVAPPEPLAAEVAAKQADEAEAEPTPTMPDRKRRTRARKAAE